MHGMNSKAGGGEGSCRECTGVQMVQEVSNKLYRREYKENQTTGAARMKYKIAEEYRCHGKKILK